MPKQALLLTWDLGAQLKMPALHLQGSISVKLYISAEEYHIMPETIKAAYADHRQTSVMRRFLVAEIGNEMFGNGRYRCSPV